MTGQLTIRADLDYVMIMNGNPCTASFTLRNEQDHTVVVQPRLSVPKDFRARLDTDRFRLRPGEARRVGVEIGVVDRRMPRGTLTLLAGDAYAWLSLFATDNWVRVASMSASSSHEGNWSPRWLADGWTYDRFRWKSSWGWVDGDYHVFPDWVMAEWNRPKVLSKARVFTLDTPQQPADIYGVRDFDVEARVDGAWRTVARVRGNTDGIIERDFPAVSADALRVWITATNDGKASRLVEIEAYGPQGRPRTVWDEAYGGPSAPFPR